MKYPIPLPLATFSTFPLIISARRSFSHTPILQWRAVRSLSINSCVNICPHLCQKCLSRKQRRCGKSTSERLFPALEWMNNEYIGTVAPKPLCKLCGSLVKRHNHEAVRSIVHSHIVHLRPVLAVHLNYRGLREVSAANSCCTTSQ